MTGPGAPFNGDENCLKFQSQNFLNLGEFYGFVKGPHAIYVLRLYFKVRMQMIVMNQVKKVISGL